MYDLYHCTYSFFSDGFLSTNFSCFFSFGALAELLLLTIDSPSSSSPPVSALLAFVLLAFCAEKAGHGAQQRNPR